MTCRLLLLLLVLSNPFAPAGLVCPVPWAPVVASWYGPKFAGKTMANGEVFDPAALTVATRVHAFGQRLLLRRGSAMVVVEVTDRGPWIAGRGLDASQGVAERLGFIEDGVVTLEVLALAE